MVLSLGPRDPQTPPRNGRTVSTGWLTGLVELIKGPSPERKLGQGTRGLLLCQRKACASCVQGTIEVALILRLLEGPFKRSDLPRREEVPSESSRFAPSWWLQLGELLLDLLLLGLEPGLLAGQPLDSGLLDPV